MPLSIFSFSKSNESVRVLSYSLLFAGLLITILEIAVNNKIDYGDTVQDSASLWGFHRERARWLKNPVIIVGGSRIQLGISVKTLERVSQRPVIQLAIDGQLSMAVLKHLLADDRVSGTILVSLRESEFSDSVPDSGLVRRWIEQYEQRHRDTIAPNVETVVKAGIQQVLKYQAVEYPPSELFRRLITEEQSIAYIVTNFSRNRDANYRLVKFPDFYIKRVLAELGTKISRKSMTHSVFNREIITALEKQPRLTAKNATVYINDLKPHVKRFEQRGGKVIFVRMPSDKLVRTIEEWRYPGNEILSAFSESGLMAVDSAKLKDIHRLSLPDGSHLDRTQKQAFTLMLLDLLYNRGWI